MKLYRKIKNVRFFTYLIAPSLYRVSTSGQKSTLTPKFYDKCLGGRKCHIFMSFLKGNWLITLHCFYFSLAFHSWYFPNFYPQTDFKLKLGKRWSLESFYELHVSALTPLQWFISFDWLPPTPFFGLFWKMRLPYKVPS